MNDLFTEFLAETKSHLASLDANLPALVKNPHDTDLIADLFRTVHTIKGTCRFFDLPTLEMAAHDAEEALAHLQKSDPDAAPEALVQLFDYIEHIKFIYSTVEATGKEPQKLPANHSKMLIEDAWAGLPYMVTELSTVLDKKITLTMAGQDTPVSSEILMLIKSPIMHIVRNAVDHGLENPAERIAAGKPDTGQITLKACQKKEFLIIEVSDDGRGLSIEKIKEQALKNELVSVQELERLSSQDIQNFIFRMGVSTAETITPISGRGIGMDVVRTNIEKAGGKVVLTSSQGKGTTIQINIPQTSESL